MNPFHPPPRRVGFLFSGGLFQPLTVLQGGGHGGSHPHLVHEFVRSILEDRDPVPSDIDGAYWTGVGICAHQSAMEGGVVKPVPVFG